MSRIAIAHKRGDFRLLGWIYGRRILYRDDHGALQLEEWFRGYFPRVPEGFQRRRALQLWRNGFLNGKSGA